MPALHSMEAQSVRGGVGAYQKNVRRSQLMGMKGF